MSLFQSFSILIGDYDDIYAHTCNFNDKRGEKIIIFMRNIYIYIYIYNLPNASGEMSDKSGLLFLTTLHLKIIIIINNNK